jgi:hypothetical protein
VDNESRIEWLDNRPGRLTGPYCISITDGEVDSFIHTFKVRINESALLGLDLVSADGESRMRSPGNITSMYTGTQVYVDFLKYIEYWIAIL